MARPLAEVSVDGPGGSLLPERVRRVLDGTAPRGGASDG
jgi:hypothetical protein